METKIYVVEIQSSCGHSSIPYTVPISYWMGGICAR